MQYTCCTAVTVMNHVSTYQYLTSFAKEHDEQFRVKPQDETPSQTLASPLQWEMP